MHECTFPIWVISIIVAVIFSVIAGVFDLRLLKTASGKVVTRNGEIRATDRIGPRKVLLVNFIFSVLTAVLFLWQYFATTEASFSGFWPTVGSIALILLTIILMVAACLILFLLYALFSYIRQSSVEAKYSRERGTSVTVTFVD